MKNNKYNLINTSGKQLLSRQENRIQYVEPDAFIIQDKKAASLFDSEGHLLFSKKFCNLEPGFPGELKVTSASNHNVISIVDFSGDKISGDRYGFLYPKENIIHSYSNSINMIEAKDLYWLRSAEGIDLTDRYKTLDQLPNGFFLGNNEDIISPDAIEIVHTDKYLKYFNEYLLLCDKGWGDNHIGIINMHGHLIGDYFSNVYLKGQFVFTDYIMEIGRGWNSKNITLHGLYAYDGKKILCSNYNYIRLLSDDLVVYSYKNESAVGCISNGRKISMFSNNAIHELATINECVYYKIGRGGYYTLVNDSLFSYGDFTDLSYDAEMKIIKGLSKDGKVYNALTKELIYVPKIPSIGDIAEGKVTGIKPYGVFVCFDSGHSGLLHISNISKNSKSISDFRKGQLLKVLIIKIESTNKFNLDLVPD
ncbi:S1 RNA-binding domain-containing protein [Bacteroides caecimuris]|uniref:S1 RNA-binding domain-containing protein n=1 Tax=Bacteroides caecimuris TaxID=1796613 RepID=UPI002573725C|nr:S1 RNA-binding domain-containing protein [Bacteroides caecimuris]